MYDDLLGNIEKEVNDDEIKLTFKRSLIDDLYALHGMMGIKTLLSLADEMLKRATISQIRHNKKENKNYYKDRSQNIFDRLMEEKRNDARNESK